MSIKEELLRKKFEFIVIVRPTSPKRPPKIISDAISLLKRDINMTSVRAMRKVSEHPFRIWKKYENYAYPLIENVFEPGNIPRQKLDDNFYFQSGELEVVRRSTLQSEVYQVLKLELLR